jgi:hypothetical protein
MSSTLSKSSAFKYRSDLKLPGNEEKLAEYNEKRKKHDKDYLENIKRDGEKLQHRRERIAAKQQRYRVNKALKSLSTPSELESAAKNLENDTSSYTNAAKSKALNRASKALPKNESKRKLIIEELNRKHNVCPQPKVPEKRPRKGFFELREIVTNFYVSEAVSRVIPGARNLIKVKQADGTDKRIEKLIMTKTISDAYEEFKKTFPDKKCSLAYFTQRRPKHVMKKSDSVHYSCLCVICENFNLLCLAFAPYFTENISHLSSSMLDALCCDRNNFQCCNNSCDTCKGYMDILRSWLKPCCSDEPIKWQKWLKNQENNFTEKFSLTGKKVTDALDEFQESFKKYKLHKFIQFTQKEYLDNTKDTQPENHAVLIVDYAEKYNTLFQNAVQSSYFGSRMISIFTARAYVGQRAEYSFALPSDHTSQGKREVFANLKYIISQLKLKHPELAHIKLFSDGCGGQFKNKYQFKNMLYALEDFGVTLELVFFATGHGKSPCDGIGAAIKRNVRVSVLAEGERVVSAAEFVQCANKFGNKVHVYELTKKEIDSYQELLDERWDECNVKGIPGTMKFHSYKCTEDSNTIEAAYTSLNHSSKLFVLI